MLENQDMSAPIKLAEGYNPFGDEEFVPQAQPAVEVAPTATNEPAQAAPPQQEETKVEEQAASTQSFDSNQFVKESPEKPIYKVIGLMEFLNLKFDEIKKDDSEARDRDTTR